MIRAKVPSEITKQRFVQILRSRICDLSRDSYRKSGTYLTLGSRSDGAHCVELWVDKFTVPDAPRTNGT